MKTGKTILRFVAFLVVLALVIIAIPGQIFGVEGAANYIRAKSYFKERKGALDAVFIGASNVHQFWQPAIAWQHRGIAVTNFSFNSLPIMCFPYLIREARKTQPNALYIINLSTFKRKQAADTIEHYHTVVDYLPMTLDKIRFIQDISKASGFSFAQQLELVFPFIRFHSRWNKLQSWNYGTKNNVYKSSVTNRSFASKVAKIKGELTLYDSRVEPEEDTMQVFTDLLDYLDREHVNVLFVKVPQMINEKYQGHLNVMTDILESRGYPCLDLMKEYEAYGLNLHRDFYDPNHTNIRGSYKLTEYMADYLAEHYHFADKRGQADYADWDRAGESYDRKVDSWILPFEREKNLWQDLPAPKRMEAKAKKSGIRLAWTASKDADGYVIYRKTSDENDGKWQLLATVGADTRSYMDEALKANTRYTYCVVPFADKDGQKAYGNYKIKGVSCRSPRQLISGSQQDKSGGDGN
jgi:hypothetical protein